MKKFSKILSVALLVALVLSLGVTSAFAATQTVAQTTPDADNATVTINNPAKGETYSVFKLFDATVSGEQIAYQGTVPDSLSAYFEADAQGNISPKGEIVDTDADGKITGTHMTDGLKAALEAWAEDEDPVASADSDGKEALAFTGLPYGYYVVTTTHKPDGENAKAAITVTSTKPNASIYDKNVNEPSVKKEVEKTSYSIGDTVKYTATFDTTNYLGSGENAKQVVEYVITDTLPPFLDKTTLTVTSFKIDGTDYKVNDAFPQFDSEGKITVPWATKDTSVSPAKFTSIYDQGVQIEIKYQAKLTSVTNINAQDTNTISIKPYVDNDNGDKKPWDKTWEDEAVITTYAAAIHKVDDKDADLKGAQFTVAGLTVEETAKGVYTVVSFDPTSATASAVMDTDDNGMLYIVGLASDASLTVTEFKAPDGYNKLTSTETLTPQVLTKQIWKLSGYEKYDEDNNLVEHKETETTDYIKVTQNLNELNANALKIENNKGVELPSTGGIGTTIFYVVGGVLVLAAIILLVTKKRMSE